MVSSSSSVITIFYGKDISEQQANELYSNLSSKYGNKIEVNILKGNQPVYYYIVSVE